MILQKERERSTSSSGREIRRTLPDRCERPILISHLYGTITCVVARNTNFKTPLCLGNKRVAERRFQFLLTIVDEESFSSEVAFVPNFV